MKYTSNTHKYYQINVYIYQCVHPLVKEKMHLQENTLFDLDLWVKVTLYVAQCPLHHVTYAHTEFEFTTSKASYKKIQYLIFDLDLGVTRNDGQYPLHHVTYSATKFEVAMSYRLGGDTFTRKYEMLPSTLYIM